MSTARFYESTSGDTWDLVREEATDEGHVKHTPNLASGGHASCMPLGDFLRLQPHSPENQALVALISSAAHAGAVQVKGYIHDPKEIDGPYIAVVLESGQEPVVTLHKSYAEAERALESQLALIQHAIV